MVQTVTFLQSAAVTPPSPTHRLLQASPAVLECQDFFLMKYLSPTDLMDHPAVMPAVLCECPPKNDHSLHQFNYFNYTHTYTHTHTHDLLHSSLLTDWPACLSQLSQECDQATYRYYRNAAFL